MVLENVFGRSVQLMIDRTPHTRSQLLFDLTLRPKHVEWGGSPEPMQCVDLFVALPVHPVPSSLSLGHSGVPGRRWVGATQHAPHRKPTMTSYINQQGYPCRVL